MNELGRYCLAGSKLERRIVKDLGLLVKIGAQSTPLTMV